MTTTAVANEPDDDHPKVRLIRGADGTDTSRATKRVEDIRIAGRTPEGYERWIIPFDIYDGDWITLAPWPPRQPVVVLCEGPGCVRRLFNYQPGDLVDERVLCNWNWDAQVTNEPPTVKVPGIDRVRVVDEMLHRFNRSMGPIPDEEPDVEPYPYEDEDRPFPMFPDDDVDLLSGQAGLKEELIALIRREHDPIVLWWMQQAASEAVATVRKAREYGSTELKYAGHVLASLGGREVSDAEAIELQCLQYCLGKLGRWVAAARRHDRVSDDSLFDLGVYVRMVQYTRKHGTWVE